jgi:DNA-binding transcriptional ArsR family regulator
MIPGPPRITLDQESFKALASDVRVGILKVLDERRQTVTDLSNHMSLSKPTLLEHLEKLQAAGLVKRIDEGRKWIYYELSDKGRKILHPEKVSIVVALGSAAALAAIGIVSLLSSTSTLLAGPASSVGLDEAGPRAFSSLAPGAVGFSILLFALAGVAVSLAFAARWWGIRRRKRLFAALAGA